MDFNGTGSPEYGSARDEYWSNQSTELESMKRKNEELLEQLIEVRVNYQSEVAKYQHQLENQSAELQARNEELQSRKEELQATKEELEVAHDKNREYEQETMLKAMLNSPAPSLGSATNQPQPELLELQRNLQSAQEDLDEAKNLLQSKEMALDDMKVVLQSKERELDETKEALESRERELDEVEKDLQSRERELEESKRELETIQKQLETKGETEKKPTPRKRMDLMRESKYQQAVESSTKVCLLK